MEERIYLSGSLVIVAPAPVYYVYYLNNMNQPASKGKWGVRKDRTPEELNQLCNASFSGLKTPCEWEFKKYDTCADEGVIISVGAIFLDKRTSGINIKHYRVFFHTWSERLGIVEHYYEDFGRNAMTCLCSNKTVEDMNKYIHLHFWELKKET